MAVVENYGELKVTDQGEKALSKVYVKVFAKYKDGTDKFFKDGYTDIRGKFEYAQFNSKNLDKIFVLSNDHGLLTREVKPPANIKKQTEKHTNLGFHKPQ